MKKFFFMFLIGMSFFVFLDNSEAQVCCDTGCFTFGNVCCGNPGETVGVEGCYNANTDQYHCPGDGNLLGECLACGDDNEWEPDVEGIPDCNACVVGSDAEGNPISAVCDARCGEGTVACDVGCCAPEDLDPPIECNQVECLPGLECSMDRNVCSGDADADDVLNDDDVCVDVPDANQKDSDGDCYLPTGERSPLFGYCGDACEGQGICASVYGDKQCCDSFAETQGDGQFFGFTQDCPQIDNGVGCWSSCFKQVGDDRITYESGACLDGVRVIKELTNGVETNRFEEGCIGIPLVPFFSNVHILITGIILSGYYLFFRK